jgi:1-acyl-sn-glycerol-3-phosphate acyltransferase
MIKKCAISLYQLYKYFVFAPLLMVLTFIFGTLAVLLAISFGPRVGTYSGVIWARLLSWATPMFLRVEGKNNIDKKQSYVVVSNHQSQYDILALYGWLGVDFKWIMKKELRKVPVLGYACETLGHIYIDRKNTESALESVCQAKKKAANGTSILFFPEGTRSRDGQLLPFKKGAFRMAMDLDIPILPVTIVNTRHILPTRSIRLVPGAARMIIHPPVDISGYDNDSLTELIEHVRTTIASKLPAD